MKLNPSKTFVFFLVFISLIIVLSMMASSSIVSPSALSNCPSYSSQSTCNSNGCFWREDGGYSWCQEVTCYLADGTDETTCTTLNTTYNVNLSCAWTEGTSSCNPVGGNFYGDSCTDFDGDESACHASYQCIWNSSGSNCYIPSQAAVQNPSCQAVVSETICQNISGCNWESPSCTGNPGGISCGDLNKSLCATT